MKNERNSVERIVDEVIDAIDNDKDIQKVLDSNPRLNRLHSLLGFGEILRNVSRENKKLLEDVIEKEAQEEKAHGGPYYDYYVALELLVNGEVMTVKQGYDPYMAENMWYVEKEPQNGIQALRKPFYTLNIPVEELDPMLDTLANFLDRFAGDKTVILTPYLVHRATGALLGQLVQTSRGSNKFVLLPENIYVNVIVP